MSTFFGKYAPNAGGSGTGSGTVTEVDTGAGLTGGPITTTGTVALAAVTASRALASDASGYPVAATTTAVELGYVNGVTSAIQTQLNSKQATLTIGNLTDAGTDGITVTGGTGSVIGSGTSLAQHVADSTHNGYLSSTDWSTFNNKQSTITTGNLTDAGTDGIVVTGGTGAVIGSGTSIAQHVADSTHNGYLSQTDWSTFNGKQASGSYITDLTGDVTASGPGSAASTVAKIQTKTVSGTTGTVNVVFSTSPTLTTPVLGAATATTINGAAITATTSGTLTLANSSTLVTSGAFSQTHTVTADTNVTYPTTGTLATLAGAETFTNKTLTSPKLNENVALTSTSTKLNLLTSAGGTTGTTSTNVVFSTSPTLVTPVLGAASATSINFGGTSLANYVEGTFTPAIKASGTAGTPVYTSGFQTGYYTRIGRMVHLVVALKWTDWTGSPTGNLYVDISNLGLTPSSSTNAFAFWQVEIDNIVLPASAIDAYCFVNPGDTNLRISVNRDNAQATPVLASSNAGATARQLYTSGFFFV